MSDEWVYELVSSYTYPKGQINEIGGPGFDSGWIGTSDEQIRVIVSNTWISPCILPQSSPPIPSSSSSSSSSSQ